MSVWKLVTEKNRYGVAIYNYLRDEGLHRLKITIGETVHILEENGEWYFGYASKDRTEKGIFPKSYVHLVECTAVKTGNTEVVQIKQQQIVQEITSVLREWGSHWKHLYVTSSEHFEQIQKQIYELINHRSKILSGTLPVDELKDIKQLVTSKIDMGNKLLNLDMVVRDEQGNILNPDETSTIQLYYQHKVATERIKKATSGPKKKTSKAVTYYSHIFFVSVRNFVCKMSEDAELLMTLYDAKEKRAITENYVVRWSKEGLASDINQLHNLRVLFTDLGSRDLHREKVYLVCYVVRVGGMEAKEIDHRRSSMASAVTGINKKGQTDGMRRPFGVAAFDVTLYMCGKLESDDEKHHSVPFLQCCEKDNLDGTLQKILANKELNNKGQSLWVSVKLLHGDIKQVREENPHLVLGNVAIARKMGFPEVILPGDVRNDLYLTLISGEFSKGSKTTDKNVEVTVKVCNEMGQGIPGIITLGGGTTPLNEYRSVIYYHEDRPRWYEIFKVAVPIEEFKASHLKFMFKHRSSNEAKDKSEKPFAMSYVRLMQENGTTLHDTQHELLVYKIDHKKFEETQVDYLKLPSTRKTLGDTQKPSCTGLSFSGKDIFIISTNVCSTKLTQNVDLLGLLNWVSHKDTLKESLLALMKVDGEEVVKFLQDVLDALFNILMQNSDSDLFDNMVFECLLYIISLVSDRKYQHFQPVLDLYIKESFSATLAYDKLIVVLKYHIDNANSADSAEKDILLKTMKSLQYCIRFVVRSRLLYNDLHGAKDQEKFEASFTQLLESITAMMCYATDSTLLVQGACLKYLPTTIPDILQVFNATRLSITLTDLLKKVPQNRLTKQKMMTVNDIVHSKLFLYPDCRAVLLPVICAQIKELLETSEEGYRGGEIRNKSRSVAKVARVLGASKHRLNQHQGYSEEIELCVKILSDVLELLFRNDVGSTMHDITEIMLTVLRTVIQSMITMDRENPLVGNLVAVMISIFRQMTAHHYEVYINHFVTRFDLLDFVMEIFMVFKDLVSSKTVYSPDWCEMIMLQNSVILKSLRFFSHTTYDHFFKQFNSQVWNNFFECAIAFLTQPALQLECFSANKRNRIIARYKDMRRETGFEIRAMWFNLGQYKKQFIPSLIGPFLEMTLIPEMELRKATIPIFFDMMQCEFYSSKTLAESFGDTKRDHTQMRGNFNEFENEMIAKLDILVEGGRGDEQYKDLFHQRMLALCEQHNSLRDQGVKFVNIVTRLMERLLEYRNIINDENKENRMSCTVNLLDFYSEINRKEMYIRYVYKLCDLHLECDNFTEAAHTLKLHSNLLNWSDQILPPLLKSHKYSICRTHRDLKEMLYYNIIDYFDKGKMWECALSICKELMKQYEEEIYDYLNLSDLLKRMSVFYDSIMKQIRPEPEYFRVAYYGRGFPAFLQNKVFVYRGKEYERLSDFSSRLLNQLPNAELMNKLTPPAEDITESREQYVQINKVEPVMDERKQRFSGKSVNAQILRFYNVNDVQRFRFSRPFYRKDPNIDNQQNDFASLWLERTVLITTYPLPGILRWFPVTASETYQMSPLRTAIETMEITNKQLKDMIIAHKSDPNLQLNPLSMKLTGIVDAAVMGGIVNYEKAFFTPEYEENHPEDQVLIEKLKDLFALQIPLLELGIKLHKQRAHHSLKPLQQRLDECFEEMRASVEGKYGKRVLEFENASFVTMRRQFSQGNTSLDNRVSEASFNSDGINGSRVSSLTKTQVHTLKSITASFNFAASTASLARNSISQNHKSTLLSPTNSKLSLTSPSPTNKLKSGKTPSKEKRRNSRKLDRESVISLPIVVSATQWYTSTPENEPISMGSLNPAAVSPGTPVFELREELTPHRPLRSEVEKEKRLSRPSSGQFLMSRPTSTSITLRGAGSETNSNRNSVGTTDSTASEENLMPPPLPVKSRSDPDYCNLPDNIPSGSATAKQHTPRLSQKPALPEPTDRGIPPQPPPKPKKHAAS